MGDIPSDRYYDTSYTNDTQPIHFSFIPMFYDVLCQRCCSTFLYIMLVTTVSVKLSVTEVTQDLGRQSNNQVTNNNLAPFFTFTFYRAREIETHTRFSFNSHFLYVRASYRISVFIFY
jgi:hypothetical protein